MERDSPQEGEETPVVAEMHSLLHRVSQGWVVPWVNKYASSPTSRDQRNKGLCI